MLTRRFQRQEEPPNGKERHGEKTKRYREWKWLHRRGDK